MPSKGLDKIFRASRFEAAAASRPAQNLQYRRDRELVDPDDKNEQRSHARGGKIESRRARSNHSPRNSSKEAVALAGLAMATINAPSGKSGRKTRINSRRRRRTLFLTTAPPTRLEVMMPVLAPSPFSKRKRASLKSRPCATRPLSRTWANSHPSRRRAVFGKYSLFRSGGGVAGKVDFDTFRQETLASPLAAAVQGFTARLGFHAGAEPKLLLARPFGRLVCAFHRIRSVEPRKLTVSALESISFMRIVKGSFLFFREDWNTRAFVLFFSISDDFFKGMPDYCYRIDPEERTIEERYGGRIGIDYINQCLKRLASDPAFDAAFDIVVDFSDACFDDSCRDPVMLKEAVGCHDDTYKKGCSKTAVIVVSPYDTACALLFKNRSATRNIQIFSTRQAAWTWIGCLPRQEE